MISFWIISFFLFIWLVLTIAYQFDYLSEKISTIDIFKLIPRWTFFSPNPGCHDYHLMYRENNDSDQTSKSHESDWNEVVIEESNSMFTFLWNPQKRLNKVVSDASSSISTFAIESKNNNEFNSKLFQLNAGYLMLLNITLSLTNVNKHFQFSLIQSQGFIDRKCEPLFISNLHTV